MNETSSIKASVHVPGKGKSKLTRLLTLEAVCDLIKLQGFDEYTTNGLIEMASRYPTQALPSFRKNINVMIGRVRAKRKKEQNDLINREEANERNRRRSETVETTSCEIQRDEIGKQCPDGEDFE